MDTPKASTPNETAGGITRLRILEANLQKINEIETRRLVLQKEIERLEEEDQALKEEADKIGGSAGYVVEEIDALPQEIQKMTIIPQDTLKRIRDEHYEWLTGD